MDKDSWKGESQGIVSHLIPYSLQPYVQRGAEDIYIYTYIHIYISGVIFFFRADSCF